MALTNQGGSSYRNVSDAVNLYGNARTTGVSISTSAAQSGLLSEGIYDVWTDVECYLKVAATANDVTTSTGYILRTGISLPLAIPNQTRIGAITASGTGTLNIHKVS